MGKKNLFLKNVLFTFIAFAIYKLIGTLAISHVKNAVVNVFLSEVTILTCALCLALATQKLNTLKLSTKGVGTGIVVGIYMALTDLFVLAVWIYRYVIGEQAVTISLWEKILFVLAMIMVGVAEEVMFRGVLLNCCLDFFGENSVSSIRIAIVASSCIFGLFHIFNILVGASLSGSIIQAINAIVIGMILGTVYVRSDKNIWSCIILHGFHDFCAFIQSGVLMGSGAKEAVSNYNSSMLFSISTMLLISIFLMRKKKLSLCVKEK